MSGPRFFFVHIMKAGGTSFLHYAHECLGSRQVWFGVDDSFVSRFPDVLSHGDIPDMLMKLEPEVFLNIPHQGARFFNGHMPFISHRALTYRGRAPHCLSVLRHPVDRVLSQLVQDAYRVGVVSGDLEELYYHPQWQAAYGCNYQAKIFSMTEEETFAGAEVSPQWQEFMNLLVLAVCATTYKRRVDALNNLLSQAKQWLAGRQRMVSMENRIQQELGRAVPHAVPIEITDSRFESAIRGLEQCAVLGITEQLDRMADDMRWRFGWNKGGIQKVNVGAEQQCGNDLRKQIARDNEADIELYEYARKLVRRQQQARLRQYSLPW